MEYQVKYFKLLEDVEIEGFSQLSKTEQNKLLNGPDKRISITTVGRCKPKVCNGHICRTYCVGKYYFQFTQSETNTFLNASSLQELLSLIVSKKKCFKDV